MNVIFDDETRIALSNLISGKEGAVIRLKVIAFGCGKPALDLMVDSKKEEDKELVVKDIPFVINSKEEIYFINTEIKYNPIAFNKGFYVHSVK